MKTILAPLDGSKLAEEALWRGLVAYPANETRLVLLHCEDLNLLSLNASAIPRDFRELEGAVGEGKQSYLRELSSRLFNLGYSARTVVARGEPAESILEVAEAERADFILLTTHGRTGLARLCLGSVAEAVIRQARLPVVVIPSAVRNKTTPSLAESCKEFMQQH